MVLCLPGPGPVAPATCGVPTVTLPLDGAAAGRRLRHFRHRFDGIAVDLAALGGPMTAALANALHDSLLPGGRLWLHGAAAPRTLPGLVAERTPADGTVWRKPDVATAAGLPALTRVGPYADLLVGCTRVVELGAGCGRFLDALRLRGIAAIGLEPDPALAAAARARGHTVVAAGLPALASAAAGADGLFAGHWLDALDADQLACTLAACRRVLPPRGRLVVRCRRGAVERLRRALTGPHWSPVRHSLVPLDADDAAVVAIAASPLPPAPAAALGAVPIATAGLPLQQPPRSWYDLERSERQVTSQGGEDGILAELFDRLGTNHRYYVEFGCGDGLQCNTTQLRRQGWHGLLMDGVAAPAAPDAVIHPAWITAENIEHLLDRHGVPAEPDLLSIDVDGNDYWIWRAITRRPRVVVIEYNANLPADRAQTIPYDPAHRWDGSDFYGASLLALAQLGRAKGYTLVYCTQAGVNAFFVRSDLLPGVEPVDPGLLYRPPNYWYRGARSRPDLNRAMLTL